MSQFITRLTAAALVGLASASGIGLCRAQAAEPTGTWATEDGRARVRTEHCGPQNQHLCGYVVWMKKPNDDAGKPRLDVSNPDAKKHDRAVLGHQLLLGLKPNAEGRYEGTVYNADNGKSYEVTVWSDSEARLSVKGCMLAVFCGSQTWERVADVVPGQLQAATNAPGGPRADREWAPKAAATTGTPAAQKAKAAATPPAPAPAAPAR
ncbi:DUF2147 domain-containing protein [uncultured Methylobacterium sp.]|jgi:uncharacterized protein (DUF2147 family)|uniref:DUF2147 domain-containing protein n=1 Tax=uncultured Methylobacterium sp. TaxID=157278 RepID=UPI002618099A|nr:DUF2147 domain-containing protein [uncultured Methylobacterium sp.]